MTVEAATARSGGGERIDALLADVGRAPMLRPFERAGDGRVQGVTENPRLVVALVLGVVRRGHWCVGVGAGDVERPLPASARAGRGAAFDAALRAVRLARSDAVHVAVVGPDAATTESARTALTLTGLVVARRSAQGWSAVGLMDRGLSQGEAASVLGISKQAVSQRLAAAAWQPEVAGRRLCERLLRAADRPPEHGGAEHG